MLRAQFQQLCHHRRRNHRHHLFLNREVRWGTTDDFTTSFLHFPLFSTALLYLANCRPVLACPDVVFPPLPEVYKQAFFEVTSRHQNYVQIFTDGSKVDDTVAAAAVSSVAPNSPFSCRLRAVSYTHLTLPTRRTV